MICVYRKEIGGMWCAVATEDERVVATSYAKRESDALKSLLESLPYNAPFQVVDEPSRLSESALTTVEAILRGEAVSVGFDLEMKYVPDYSRRVLNCVFRVPVGYVTTYKAVADAVGGGPRAVGQVMASNPLAPIVPCHRVVCSDFGLGGFGGGFGEGVKTKRELLEREDRGYREPKKMKVGGGVLALFPVGFVLERLKSS